MARRVQLALVAVAFALATCSTAEGRLVAAYSQQAATDPFGVGNDDVHVVDPLDTSAALDPNNPDEKLLSHVNTGVAEGEVSLSADGNRLLLFRDNHLDDSNVSPSTGIPPDSWVVVDRKLSFPLAVTPMTIDGSTATKGGAGWFPDGRKIAFVHDALGFAQVEQLNGRQPIHATESDRVSSGLSGGPIFMRFVAVATDGTLAWPAYDRSGAREVMIVNRVGGQPLVAQAPRPLTGGVQLEDVSFGANRSEIFFTYKVVHHIDDSTPDQVRRDLGGIRLDENPPLFERYDPFLESILPGITAGQEGFPRWTADGRYFAWIEFGSQQRIRVLDRLTQTIVNVGRPLGTRPVRSFALGESDVVLPTFISPEIIKLGATVPLTMQLAIPTSIGLLVERIAGHRNLFGRRVPRLMVVGRVPLGRHQRGRLKLRWDGRVGGRPLPPGRYLVTLRALKHGVVDDLSKPRTLVIRRPRSGNRG